MGLVQSFCCGCTLQQGTIVSGIISTIRAVFSVMAGTIVLIQQLTYSSEEYDQSARRLALVAAVVLFGIGLIVLIVSSLLFVGVSKQKAGYILPWIVWQSIEFFLVTCMLILRCIGRNNMTPPDRGVGPFSIIFMIYLYIVVLSYYKALQIPPPSEIPMAVRMTQINMTPGGYPNQPGYVVTLTGPTSPMAPITGYDPRSPGMAPIGPAAYNPVGASAGYNPGAHGMPPPPPGFVYPGDVKPGVPMQFPLNPEYPPNPPPYQPPPPYSQV